MLDPKIQEWFDEFSKQITREDEMDGSALSINLNRPEDRARIVSANADTTTGVEPVLPPSGELSDEEKTYLYEKAKEGNLFIFSLGAPETPVQITAETSNILRLFPNDVLEVKEPVCKKLGFFKNLLHSLFGFYEEEHQNYQREYEIARKEYGYNLGKEKFIDAKNRHWDAFGDWRNEQINDNSEMWRRGARNLLTSVEKKLQDENLPSWNKTALQARERLLHGLIEGGDNYTKEDFQEMVVTLIVDRLLSKKKELADQFGTNPEMHQQLREVVSQSIAVKDMMKKSDAALKGAIVNCAFGDIPMDNLADGYSVEVKERIAVANLLHKENKRGPVGTSIADLKGIFADEAVTQRLIQLRNARERIPKEQLKAVTTIKRGGVIEECEYYMSRKDVEIDDERVLNVCKQDQAERNSLNKVKEKSGPTTSV